MHFMGRDKNILKVWAIISLFVGLIVFLGYFASKTYGNPGILYGAIIFSIAMNIFGYLFSDKIVIKLSGAVPADPRQFPELFYAIQNLAMSSGMPVPKIYIINDPAPNAFATGRNKNHSAIAVTTGLLKLMDKMELEGVIAHELSHIGNSDILLSTIVAVLAGVVTILADFFMRALIRKDDREGGAGAGFMLAIGLILSIIAPLAALVIQLAISRSREYLADATGAQLTRYPMGLANALDKIRGYSGRLKNVHNATAHLYIANPFGTKNLGAGSSLFLTHPPIEERIRALREMRLN